jgi:hypothetical protein
MLTPEQRHDLANVLNNIYAMLYAHERGWEVLTPSMVEQLVLMAGKIAKVIGAEDRILKNSYHLVVQLRDEENDEVA